MSYRSKQSLKDIKLRKSQLFKFAMNMAMMIFMLVFFHDSLFAQGVPGPPVFPGTPDPAPIDGGIGLLAAAGGVYAIKKLRDKNK